MISLRLGDASLSPSTTRIKYTSPLSSRLCFHLRIHFQLFSVGRGGAGNILSPSRDVSRMRDSIASEHDIIRHADEAREASPVRHRSTALAPKATFTYELLTRGDFVALLWPWWTRKHRALRVAFPLS